MYILGISAYYHDSSAALLQDGRIIVAIQEERLSRIKHDRSFPQLAILKCLETAGISIADIDLIVYYEKPFWKFERILDTVTYHIPFSFPQFSKAIPLWVKNRLWISAEIKKKLKYKGKILYASHHESHAAAAYYSSGMDNAAILTLDGVGEYATTTLSMAEGNKITVLQEQNYPHSLGLLYSAFTQYCGFKVNSGEYKLMGLAPYGKPVHQQKIYDHLIQSYSDGSYRLNMKYFNYSEGLNMINKKFIALFGKPARHPESEMDPFYIDMAASIQIVLEELVLKLVECTKSLTQKENIVFTGGVALNCKLNQKIVESGIFKNQYFYPCPGDAGSAVGAAYLGWHGYLQKEKTPVVHSPVYIGNSFSSAIILEQLDQLQIPYTVSENTTAIIAEKLAAGRIIGWFNHRMEFGPRALGNRSILADPRKPEMKDILNEKIKLRESFRPFAPIVLEGAAHELFDLHPANYDTMMVTAKAKPGALDLMPAVIHQDGTARIQLVSKELNSKGFELVEAFYQLTGCPALINTSFNIRGEPIVESPIDALRTFLYTDIDILVFNAEIMLEKNADTEKLKHIIKPVNYAAD